MTEEVARPAPAAPPRTDHDGESPAGRPGSLPPGGPAPPPDDQNPAITDARKTFVITVASILLFVAFVVLFVL